MNRRFRSAKGLGFVIAGVVLGSVSLLDGAPVSAAVVQVDLAAFDIDDTPQGQNCVESGWGFSTSSGKFVSITLNGATGVDPNTGITGFQSTFFVPSGGAPLESLSTGTSAEVNSSAQNVPAFTLAYVCGSVTPPSSSTTTPNTSTPSTSTPSTSTPSTVVPSSTTPDVSSTTPEATGTTSPGTAEVPTDDGSGSASPTPTPVAAEPQLATTGIYDRMLVVMSLLFVAIGSVLYLVSRPADQR
ncbi:MAG: hypothetical protein ACO225_00755 [Ilumatobacteraceae bacterium]